jgi:hypothetical protein
MRAMRPLATRRANSGGGIGARDDDDRNPLGHFFQPLRESDALRGRCVRLVEVVEHEGAWQWQCREQIAEKAANEAREVLLRLRRELRQRRRRLAGELLCGDPQVMQECRSVGIAGVVLVPEVAPVPRLEIASHERRLSGARCRA